MKTLRYFVLWVVTAVGFSNASAFSPLFSSITSPRTRTAKKGLTAVRGGGSESLVDEQQQQQQQPPEEISPFPTSVTTTAAAAVPGLAATGGTLLAAAGRMYTQQLDKYPIFTKSYTAGIIFALSDYIAQTIEKPDKAANKKVDRTRLLASTLVGFLYFGPAAHYWYELIFKLLPGSSLVSTLQKAVLGQLIFGPSFTSIFFATSLLQSGQFSLRSWWQKIKSDLPGAWIAGAGFWPLVDIVSYSMIPVKWIPLFINLCSLVWTVYLSRVANQSKK